MRAWVYLPPFDRLRDKKKGWPLPPWEIDNNHKNLNNKYPNN